MSTQAKSEYVEEALSEQAVCEFLAANPEFFERNAKVLARLRIPHEAGGTVSLVERQVSMLRQKEVKLERQLKDLIRVARDNDALAAKIHRLCIHLLAAGDLNATVAAIEEAMRSGFGADQAVLVLFGIPDDFDNVSTGRFFRVIHRDDEALGPFATFLKGSGPRCGQVRDAQRNFLFKGDAEDVGSVALVPLGDKASIGFLAIGSVDANRFHPGMSIDFLSRVGEIISGALTRY
jgi:uncharacterized protein YigA (DUF484 family)